MKAERRHELKENDLTHAIEVGRTYLQGHGKSLGFAVLAVIAAVVVTSLVARSREAAAEDRWDKMSQLVFDTPEATKRSLDELGTLAAASEDDRFALYALISKGRRALEAATSGDALPDEALNGVARDAFETILRRFPQNPVAVGVGNLGLATVEENDFGLDGNADHKAKAASHLKAVMDDSRLHTMPFYQTALDRSESIDATFTKVVFKPAPPKPEPEEVRVGPLAPVEPPQPIASPKPVETDQPVDAGTETTMEGTTLNIGRPPSSGTQAAPKPADGGADAKAPEKTESDKGDAGSESEPAEEAGPDKQP